MVKGKQTAVKRKRGHKDAEQSPVVSKRPILQVSTGINIPAGRHSSENGQGDSDNEDSALSSAGDEQQREAFEKLKQQNEALLKANDQLKQDRLGLRKEQNRAQDEIHYLKNVVAIARQKEAWLAVKRPTITKEGSVDFRLTSTQELLGLQLDGEDSDSSGQVNARGLLKEQCWKYLLTCSRDTVTCGTTQGLIDVLPDWRHIKPVTIKEKLLDKFDEMVRDIPCLKALFHHGDKYKKNQEAEVWENHWPLAEMLKSTMDGIKGTDKRQKDVKSWLLWNMMAERPEDEHEDDGPPSVGDWPPPRARQLTTQIIHRRTNSKSGEHSDQYQQDDSPQPRSKRHRDTIALDEDDDSMNQEKEAQASGSGTQASG